jgi:hypothetical protein
MTLKTYPLVYSILILILNITLVDSTLSGRPLFDLSCDELDKSNCLSKYYCAWCNSNYSDYFLNIENDQHGNCIKYNFCNVDKNSSFSQNCVYNSNTTNCFFIKLFEYSAVITLYILCILIFCNIYREHRIRKLFGNDNYDYYFNQGNINLLYQNEELNQKRKKGEKNTCMYLLITTTICTPSLALFFINSFYFGCFTFGMLVLICFASCLNCRTINKKKIKHEKTPLLT